MSARSLDLAMLASSAANAAVAPLVAPLSTTRASAVSRTSTLKLLAHASMSRAGYNDEKGRDFACLD